MHLHAFLERDNFLLLWNSIQQTTGFIMARTPYYNTTRVNREYVISVVSWLFRIKTMLCCNHLYNSEKKFPVLGIVYKWHSSLSVLRHQYI